MTIHVLLKGLTSVPPATFHGIAITEGEQSVWDNGHEDNWSYAIDVEEGPVVLTDPITYAAAENGILE